VAGFLVTLFPHDQELALDRLSALFQKPPISLTEARPFEAAGGKDAVANIRIADETRREKRDEAAP
jgi:hypothetical protein